MSVNTGGPIRGFIGRWLMRFEVSQNILNMFFRGTTAVSALSGVLAYGGFQDAILPILAAWGLVMPILAYAMADGGVSNRKNKEKAKFVNNFSRPDMAIDDCMTGAAVFAAVHGRKPDDEELEVIKESVFEEYEEHTNGVDL